MNETLQIIECKNPALEVLKDIQLRLCQTRFASSIGRKKDRTPFLLGELARIESIVDAAIEKAVAL